MKNKVQLLVGVGLILLRISQVCLSDHQEEFRDGIEGKTCPTWMVPTAVNGTCECGVDFGGRVRCDNQTMSVQLMAGYCIDTFEGDADSEIEGDSEMVRSCLYTLYADVHNWYLSVPLNRSALRQFLCDRFNREGSFCGTCKPSYSLPAYSYSMGCVKCSYHPYNWLMYIASAFIPLTIFYVIVVAFRIHATSAKMQSYILVCQLAACPSHMRVLSIMQGSVAYQHDSVFKCMKIFSAVFGIWNLDFGRGLYEPTCLHPKMTMLHLITMDYVIALYPFCLIFVTFVFVRLHDRYEVVVKLWRPFYWCFSFVRKEWNIKLSLIEVFATFLLLSYVKLISISIDIMPGSPAIAVDGSNVENMYFYDIRAPYFGKVNFPSTILSICIFSLLVLFPLLLVCLYPCQCFHKLLNCCNLRCIVLHTYMDVFQSCYRTRPRDCRHFARVYLLLRIVILSLFFDEFSRFYGPAAGCCHLLTALIVILVRPYKSAMYNNIDAFFLFLSAFVYFVYSAMLHTSVSDAYFLHVIPVTVNAAMALPAIYGMILVVHGLGKWRKLDQVRVFCWNQWLKMTRTEQEMAEQPPYRLEHSDEYPPLLPNP